MASKKPLEVTKAQIDSAQNIWSNFTKLMKYSIIATIAVLAILGLALIDW